VGFTTAFEERAMRRSVIPDQRCILCLGLYPVYDLHA
jgi:hypothetical protein